MFEQARHENHLQESQAARREDSLLQRFNRHFTTRSADTSDLIRRAQEIRYQVYCVERPFENPAAHPDRREKDQRDRHSGISPVRPHTE